MSRASNRGSSNSNVRHAPSELFFASRRAGALVRLSHDDLQLTHAPGRQLYSYCGPGIGRQVGSGTGGVASRATKSDPRNAGTQLRLYAARRVLKQLQAVPTEPETPTERPNLNGSIPDSFSKTPLKQARDPLTAAYVFPHCPRCASYALYRRNNAGVYECQTCGLQDIDEVTARRVQ
jgi:Zn ribbon nucleic-acid-binding protein